MYTKKGSLSRKIRFVYKKCTKFLYYKSINLKKQKAPQKIFCIGFIKTGTKSLGQTLLDLGYDHLTYNPYINNDFQNANTDKLLHLASKFESFDDIPWNDEKLIPALDKNFPNSKFIYLQRDENEWLDSFKNWSDYLTSNEIDYTDWFNRFKAHKKFVEAYFKGREEDIIHINVKKKEDFNRLLGFLGKTSELTDFPHKNRTRVEG